MSFCNWNLLPQVLGAIPRSPFQYRLFSAKAVNEYGQSQATYGEWQDGFGSVQPASEDNTHVEGIDYSPKSVTVWIYGVRLHGTHGQGAPDQIRYCESIYNVTSVDDWDAYDKYCKCTCQEVTNEGGTASS